MNYGCDEYWEERRKRLTRARRRAAWREMLATFVYAVLAVAAICGVMWLAYWAANRETFERAAYNEGRYGVSRAEAWQLAKEGVGMTSDELGMRN